jgi:hypothetical protein
MVSSEQYEDEKLEGNCNQIVSRSLPLDLSSLASLKRTRACAPHPQTQLHINNHPALVRFHSTRARERLPPLCSKPRFRHFDWDTLSRPPSPPPTTSHPPFLLYTRYCLLHPEPPNETGFRAKSVMILSTVNHSDFLFWISFVK